jgi:hypothetical protein
MNNGYRTLASLLAAASAVLTACNEWSYDSPGDSDNTAAAATPSDLTAVRSAAENLLSTKLPASAVISHWRVAPGADAMFVFRLEISDQDWASYLSSNSSMVATPEIEILQTPLIPLWARHSSSAISVNDRCWYRAETVGGSVDSRTLYCWVVSDGSNSPFAIAAMCIASPQRPFPNQLFELDGPKP